MRGQRALVTVCLTGSVLIASSVLSLADGAAPDSQRLYEEQKHRNDDLERRVRLLEEQSTQEVNVAKADMPEATLSFLKQTEISGLVSASYIYNFNSPTNRENTGRGFDRRHNEFMLNKAALSLDKAVEYDAFAWNAGYTVKLLFGQDARYTQTDLNLGDDGDLFEANATVNVPVGNGLKVTMGKFGTPMGYEASYTEENYNWSGGLQWALVEPFTHTGVKASYAVNPQWEFEFCAFNGWDIVQDNNNAKSFMGHVTYTPREATTVSLIGYGGAEQDDDTSDVRRGVELYVQQKLSPTVTGVAQFDAGAEDAADADGGAATWWAGGLWLIYEPSERWSVAARGDYLSDPDGARTSGAPSVAPFPENTGMDLYSLTLTLNHKPVKELRIAPEVRWDHSTEADTFDGKQDQVTAGMGAAYFF